MWSIAFSGTASSMHKLKRKLYETKYEEDGAHTIQEDVLAFFGAIDTAIDEITSVDPDYGCGCSGTAKSGGGGTISRGVCTLHVDPSRTTRCAREKPRPRPPL